jgi:hypothetical protein
MAPRKDLLTFLFGESAEAESAEHDQHELEIAENLEQLFEVAAEAEQGELEAKKTPLAKALSEFGIGDADLQLDTEGFVLATDNHDKYVDACTVLGSADAMHKLAEMGWVVTHPGDVAMTNEVPDYRIRFLEITTVDQNDREPKAGTYDDANREEVIKNAQEFAATKMDRDDDLNPVENEDDKISKKNVGVGKEKDGEEPEKAIHDALTSGDFDSVMEVYYGGGDWEKGKEVHCPKCGAEAKCSGSSEGKPHLQCPKCGHKWHGEPKNPAQESALSEMTTTGSMGTAMSMGQPHVGMVKKPKPYGKGTKFKMPGQWKVRQPVVDQQVKRKVKSEGLSPIEQAEAFLKEDESEADFAGQIASDDELRGDEGEGGVDEAYQTMLNDLETGECAIFDDSRSGPTVVRFNGQELGRFSDFNEGLAAVNAAMEAAQFWPNIYHVNDHGNVSLLDKSGNSIKDWV